MLLTILYAVWTNIYIVMYAAVSHVRSNVKQNPIKSCRLATFLRFWRFPGAEKGPCNARKTLKKQQEGPVWIWLSQSTIIIMYVSFYNHVRRDDKYLCYHVRCWPSCTLFGQMSILSCTLLSVMFVTMSNKIRLKSAPLLLFYVFYVFPVQQRAPAVLGKRKKGSKRVWFESD